MSKNSERYCLAQIPKHRDVERFFAKTLSDGTNPPMVVRRPKTTTDCVTPPSGQNPPVSLLTLGEADRLDIVTIRIQHERAVVRRTVIRPRTGPAVVAPAGLHRRIIEFTHGRAILRQNRHVRIAVRTAFFVSDPDPLLIGSCEACVLLLVVAEDERVS